MRGTERNVAENAAIAAMLAGSAMGEMQNPLPRRHEMGFKFPSGGRQLSWMRRTDTVEWLSASLNRRFRYEWVMTELVRGWYLPEGDNTEFHVARLPWE